MAKALSAATGKNVPSAQLPVRSITLDDQLKQVKFRALGKSWQCELEQDYLLIEVSQESTEAEFSSGVDVLSEPQSSQRTGQETSIRFRNEFSEAISLFWVDTKGRRVSYGTIPSDQVRDQHTFAGHVWVLESPTGTLLGMFRATDAEGDVVIDVTQPKSSRSSQAPSRKVRRPGQRRGAVSPDGEWRAFIRDYNLFIARNKQSAENDPGDESIALSTNGTAEDSYRADFYWSPDSQKLAVPQVRQGENRQIHLIESSPQDQLQPKLHTLSYAKPGDRLPLTKPRLFDIRSRSMVSVSEELFPNPWSVTQLRWRPDSSALTFLYNQRGHQVMRIVAIDASSGTTRAIVDEQCPTFFDYAGKKVYALSRPNRRAHLDERERRLEPPLFVRCRHWQRQKPDYAREMGHP